MYTITGITGKVGGLLAHALLAEGRSVRAVVRDAGKGRAWAELGCGVALADMRYYGATATGTRSLPELSMCYRRPTSDAGDFAASH
jgi:uncharacterized protein YbjT (DUF2867 family)